MDLFEDAGLPLTDRIRRSARFACWSSQTDEWYTPPQVIEAARATMGGIDLDPASCPSANLTIAASAYYSERVNGLDRLNPWLGRIWINPPYGGKAELFTGRLLSELSPAGEVTQAIVLLGSQALVTKWADPAVRRSNAIGVSRGRWEFRPGNGQIISSPAGGSSLLYFGDRVEAFSRHFESLAHVMLPSWRNR